MKIQVPTKEFVDGMHRWQAKLLADFDAKLARFFLVSWHRRARKTTLALNILIREAVKNPNQRFGYIAPTYRSAKNIAWRDPNMIKKYLPMELVKKLNESEMFVEFTNGAILSLHGGDDPDTLRGVNFHGIVIDEASQCKQSLYEEILRPIIAQDKSRWVIFIFTPSGKNWIHNYWVRAKEMDEWKQYILKAEDSHIIPLDELDKIKRELPQATYMQEFQCEFSDNSASVFKNINQCASGKLDGVKPSYTYVTGVDLGRYQDFTVLITICRETQAVVDFQRFNTVDWALQKERIIQVCNKFKSLAVVDATGLGDPIAEDLFRQGVSVLPFKISSASKKELIEKLIVAIEQRLITFPNIEELIDELSSFQYFLTDAGNVQMSAPDGMHDDCVISLGLAVYGLKNFLYGSKRIRNPIQSNLVTKIKQDREVLNAGVSY